MRQILFICMLLSVPAGLVVGASHDEAIASAIEALATAPHAGARRSAIEALAALNDEGPLPESAVAALLTAATSDADISIRVEASGLLARLPIPDAARTALGLYWAETIANPAAPEWKKIHHPVRPVDVHVKATKLLASLFEPPYPDPVIDAWIAELRVFAASDAAALLHEVRKRQGFTEEQISRIKIMGARGYTVELRDTIFALVAEPLEGERLAETVDDFENARKASDRLFAGYALKLNFTDRPVPADVVAAADRVLHKERHQEVRGVAAVLIARGETAFDERENMLLAGLRTSASNKEIPAALLAMYGDDRLQELVARYAADPWAPDSIKFYLIYELRAQARPGDRLAPATRDALIEAAWQASGYTLIAAIRGALEAWGEETPWIAYVKSSSFQSKVLLGLFAFCGLLVAIGGLTALAFILVRPYEGQRAGAKRAGAAFGWVVLSIVMLGLLAFAFVGFLGHNFAPKPPETLAFNIPMYFGTLIYLSIALAIVVGARRDKGSHSG